MSGSHGRTKAQKFLTLRYNFNINAHKNVYAFLQFVHAVHLLSAFSCFYVFYCGKGLTWNDAPLNQTWLQVDARCFDCSVTQFVCAIRGNRGTCRAHLDTLSPNIMFLGSRKTVNMHRYGPFFGSQSLWKQANNVKCVTIYGTTSKLKWNLNSLHNFSTFQSFQQLYKKYYIRHEPWQA